MHNFGLSGAWQVGVPAYLPESAPKVSNLILRLEQLILKEKGLLQACKVYMLYKAQVLVVLTCSDFAQPQKGTIANCATIYLKIRVAFAFSKTMCLCVKIRFPNVASCSGTSNSQRDQRIFGDVLNY